MKRGPCQHDRPCAQTLLRLYFQQSHYTDSHDLAKERLNSLPYLLPRAPSSQIIYPARPPRDEVLHSVRPLYQLPGHIPRPSTSPCEKIYLKPYTTSSFIGFEAHSLIQGLQQPQVQPSGLERQSSSAKAQKATQARGSDILALRPKAQQGKESGNHHVE